MNESWWSDNAEKQNMPRESAKGGFKIPELLKSVQYAINLNQTCLFEVSQEVAEG